MNLLLHIDYSELSPESVDGGINSNCANVNNTMETPDIYNGIESVTIADSNPIFTPKSARRHSTPAGKSASRRRSRRLSAKKLRAARRASITRSTKSSMSKLRSKSADEVLMPAKTESFLPTAEIDTKQPKQLTLPKSPKFEVEKRLKEHKRPVPMSSEELELMKMTKEREEELLRVQKHKQMYNIIKVRRLSVTKGDHECDNIAAPTNQSTKTVTVPKTPNFALNKRKGRKSIMRKSLTPRRSLNRMSNEFKKQKRATMLTIPQPFHFATDDRLKKSGELENSKKVHHEVILAGEAMQQFTQHIRAHPTSSVDACRTTTQPHAPLLRTELRSKSTTKPVPSSREECEAKEMEVFQAQPFKARPLDKRIFSSMGELGVPKVPARPVTEPTAFELQSDKRALMHRSSMDGSKEDFEVAKQFKARPVPTHLFQQQPHHPPKPKHEIKPTVPISPKLSGGGATAIPLHRQRPSTAEPDHAPYHANNNASKEFKPTEPKAFKLQTESRGQQHRAALIERLIREKQEEQNAREFEAPDKPKYLHHEHFHPAINNEHKRESILKQLEAEQKRLSQFKARPVPKTMEKAFVIEHLRRPLVMPTNVKLQTDDRAVKRKEFNLNINQKMIQLEEMQKALLLEKTKQEDDAIKQLRRKSTLDGGMMFKAQQICQRSASANKSRSSSAAKRVAVTAATQISASMEVAEDGLQSPCSHQTTTTKASGTTLATESTSRTALKTRTSVGTPNTSASTRTTRSSTNATAKSDKAAPASASKVFSPVADNHESHVTSPAFQQAITHNF